ncbi:MAG: response regulator [Proteobacteria bacterium]|nr:response regulator [Pseudomonadota bacterium]
MMKRYNLLIADRNPHIRNFLKREMQADGYNVQLAKNGREVLSLIYSPMPIDLLIIDLDLPGANELNLLKCLEDRIPVLPFVIHSDLFDYLESTSHISKAAFVPKHGSSSETLKDVVLNLLKESCIKKYKTPEDWKK